MNHLLNKLLVTFIVGIYAATFGVGVVEAVRSASSLLSPPPAAPVFGACAKDTGLLTMFATSQAECPQGQTFVTWNQTGPQGPKGDPGLTGYTVVSSGWLPVRPGGIVHVLCPTGEVALGGGVDLSTTRMSSISHDRPFQNGRGWEGAYTGLASALRVWAVCAQVA